MTYTKDRSVYLNLKYDQYTGHNQQYIPAASVRKLQRTLTGEVNSKHRTQIQNVENATTPLTARYQSVDYNPGFARVLMRYPHNQNASPKEFWYRGNAEFNQPTPSFPTEDPEWQNVENRATMALHKRIREIHTQLSGMVALGEVRETLRMLRMPMQGLWRSADRYLRRLKREAKKRRASHPKELPASAEFADFLSKAAAAAWLETQFGWKPLIADAMDAAEAWDRLSEKREVVKFSVGAKGSVLRDQTTSTSVAATYCFQLATRRRWMERMIRYKGACMSRAEATPWNNYELFGFAAEEFVPTAWELLPWSFLVDYFVNVGDILEAGFTRWSDVRWINKTVVTRNHTLVMRRLNFDFLRNTYPRDFVLGEESQETMKLTSKIVNRSVNTSFPYPTLEVRLPGAKQKLNIAALLTSALDLHPQKRR